MIHIITYQDLQQIGDNEQDKMNFVRNVISHYQNSDEYKKAFEGDAYSRQQNIEAVNREKLYRDFMGQLQVDEWCPNHRIRSNYFDILTTQLNQYLLGNGVTLKEPTNKDKLGKDFDVRFNRAGKQALDMILSFLFWNLDHIEVFTSLEFCPLWDEETGALRSGVRFWRIADNKPLRPPLYEDDGYTEYIWSVNKDKDGKSREYGAVLHEKRAYNVTIKTSEIDGTQIVDGQNYPAFPIVPFWANSKHQSELDGIKAHIDTIDELVNSLADDLTEAQLYWLISGADGMDKGDLIHFLNELRNTRVANPADGQNVQPYTVNIPYVERQAEIERLDRQIYKDFQGLNVEEVKGGAVTATQIKAAYEPINSKADKYEYQVLDFIQGILKIAGIEDSPTFNRSMITNTNEEIQIILQAAQYLPEEYVTKKIVTILGDKEALEDIQAEMDRENMERLTPEEEEEENAEE